MSTAFVTPKWLHKSPFQLEGMALEMPEMVEPHLNRVPFRGILTQVDEPSTRPPNGSSGHRVLIPRGVAEQALPSLMGMPIDCSLGLKDHDKTTVIGVITGAEIQGSDLVVIGHLLGKNFPTEIAEIQSKKSQLGMSYEISNVHVEDVNAEIWTLTGLQFTGAAILYKKAAAYQHTAIAARAEEDDILSKLQAIDGTLRTIQASKMDEADEAAAKEEADAKAKEEEAARYDATAMQARDDSDEEDAAKQEEDAAKARQDASALRLSAAKRHEEAAMKLRAAKHEEDAAKEEAETEAKRHDEEAKRLKEEDESCKAAAAAAKADTDAAKAEDAATEGQDAQAELMARMLMAMMGQKTQEAAAKPAKKDQGDQNVHMIGMLLRAMTYMPGMMEGQSKPKHDDKEQDVALIRELLRKGADKPMAASGVVSLEEKRRMRRMEASMQLLTDQVSKLTGLMTDVVHGRRDLATDAERGANGGPVRRTLQATTEQWVEKYGDTALPVKRTDGKMTDTEINAALDSQGITDPADRIARKVELQRAGKTITN
jgi:hypothetical protein